jgi:hypothetical protein
MSVVTGGLAALWPPLTSASPAATGLTGQGVQRFFVATPGLTAATGSPAPAAPAAPPGNPYGY